MVASLQMRTTGPPPRKLFSTLLKDSKQVSALSILPLTKPLTRVTNTLTSTFPSTTSNCNLVFWPFSAIYPCTILMCPMRLIPKWKLTTISKRDLQLHGIYNVKRSTTEKNFSKSSFLQAWKPTRAWQTLSKCLSVWQFSFLLQFSLSLPAKVCYKVPQYLLSAFWFRSL